MISQVIQTACVGVIPKTYFSMGDENITAPYCVHRESSTPQYMKGVIVEYSWEVEIAIIADDPAELESLGNSIRTAIGNLERTTSSSTYIQDVTYLGDSPEYDEEENLYVTVLRYTITTTNR